jgi:hypothetical protein
MKLELLDEYLDFFEGKIFSSHREFMKSMGLFVLEESFDESFNNYINLCPSIKSLNEVEIGPLDVVFLGYINYLEVPQIFFPLNRDQSVLNLTWNTHLENRKTGYPFDIQSIETFSKTEYEKEEYEILLLSFPAQEEYFFVGLCKESDIYKK